MDDPQIRNRFCARHSRLVRYLRIEVNKSQAKKWRVSFLKDMTLWTKGSTIIDVTDLRWKGVKDFMTTVLRPMLCNKKRDDEDRGESKNCP